VPRRGLLGISADFLRIESVSQKIPRRGTLLGSEGEKRHGHRGYQQTKARSGESGHGGTFAGSVLRFVMERS